MTHGWGRTVSALVAAAVAVAAYLAIQLTRPGSPALMTVLTRGLAVAPALVSGVLWLRAARWASGRARLALRLASGAMLGWAAGEVIRIGDYLLHGPRPGAPLSATLLFLATTLLVPVAVLLLFGARNFTSLRTVLDALLIAASTLYVAWSVALHTVYRARGGGVGALTSLGYSLADIAFIAIVLILVRDAAPILRTPAALVATGLILKCASDFASSYFSVRATASQGALTDIGWLVAFVAIALATPRRPEIAGLAEGPDGQSAWLFLPYAPFLLALVTAGVLFVAKHGHVDPTQYLISVVLVVLILLRQLITQHDNRALTRRLKTAAEDLRYRAYHDPLTGMANRDKFMESVERRLAAPTGPQIAVLYIDLDGFKPINDTFGHAAGDRALAAVAERLTRATRTGDLVARLGGDEFAVLLPDLHYMPDAHSVAQRIQSALDTDLDITDGPVRVGASIGVAYGRPGRIGLGELLRNADVAMYTAKLQGRRRTVTFDPRLLTRRRLDQAS
ncbi:GGDEF domain-containing protein [Planosporangium thailandense]|uniref:GGDEF domain-containing protein n=1 Tax=Planosporangium thailandense TaxID=765197 RepID=A0ABX0Y2N0_9ACTN|nr:GGDEF domain-containing protein [Planosporangium thailandense]NJC72615.1 GGDEF domain-containing protein [Planosporangium thailandense]